MHNRRRSPNILLIAVLALAVAGCQPVSVVALTARLTPGHLGVATLDDGAVVRLTTERPLTTGSHPLALDIVDAFGRPVGDAAVSVDFDMTLMCMAKDVVPVSTTGNGTYGLQFDFPMAGPWKLTALIDRPGHARATTEFTFDVSDPATAPDGGRMPFPLALSVSLMAIGASLGTGLAFSRKGLPMTDMLGMMLGMTLGMVTGLSVGTWLGLATDLFVSNTVALLVAAAIGAGFGRLGGWMGIIDGGLSGVMGGTMGAMLGVMIGVSPMAIWVTATLMALVHAGAIAALFQLRRKLETAAAVIDPVCGMAVHPATAPAQTVYQGQTVYFCAPGCRRAFERHPEQYVAALHPTVTPGVEPTLAAEGPSA